MKSASTCWKDTSLTSSARASAICICLISSIVLRTKVDSTFHRLSSRRLSIVCIRGCPFCVSCKDSDVAGWGFASPLHNAGSWRTTESGKKITWKSGIRHDLSSKCLCSLSSTGMQGRLGSLLSSNSNSMETPGIKSKLCTRTALDHGNAIHARGAWPRVDYGLKKAHVVSS